MGDHVGDLAAFHGEGVAEVAAGEDIFPVVEVLDGEWFVQAVVGFEGGLFGRGGGFFRCEGVAGDGADGEEGEGDEGEDDDDGLEEAGEDGLNHGG